MFSTMLFSCLSTTRDDSAPGQAGHLPLVLQMPHPAATSPPLSPCLLCSRTPASASDPRAHQTSPLLRTLLSVFALLQIPCLQPCLRRAPSLLLKWPSAQTGCLIKHTEVPSPVTLRPGVCLPHSSTPLACLGSASSFLCHPIRSIEWTLQRTGH